MKKETVLVERTQGWFTSCYRTLRTLFIATLLIVLAAIGGYWYAHTQTQELEKGAFQNEKICEVDRANWGADKRQIKALHVSWNECERKLTNVNNKLEEMQKKYHKIDLEKKENEIKLDGREKEETKDLKALETCQEKLTTCNALLYGDERNAKLKLEIEYEELKKKLNQRQELINEQSREQQQKDQHSHEQQKDQHSHKEL